MARTTATPRATAKTVRAVRTGSPASGLTIKRQKSFRRVFTRDHSRYGLDGCVCYPRRRSFASYVGDLAVAKCDDDVGDRRGIGAVSGDERGSILFTREAEEQFQDRVAGAGI